MERDVFKEPEVGDAFAFHMTDGDKRVVVTGTEQRDSGVFAHWSMEDDFGMLRPRHPRVLWFVHELMGYGAQVTYLGKDDALVEKANVDREDYWRKYDRALEAMFEAG